MKNSTKAITTPEAIFNSIISYADGLFTDIKNNIGKRSYQSAINVRETALGRKSSLNAVRKIDAVVAQWIKVENFSKENEKGFTPLDIQSGSEKIMKMKKVSELFNRVIKTDDKKVSTLVSKEGEALTKAVRSAKTSFKNELAKAKNYSDADIKLLANNDMPDAKFFGYIKTMCAFNARLTEYVPTVKVVKKDGAVKITNVDAKAMRLNAKAKKAKAAGAGDAVKA